MNKKVKNWLRGAASVAQIWPDTSTRVREMLPRRTDAEALYGDWQRVGGDIRKAIGQYADEQKTDEQKTA